MLMGIAFFMILTYTPTYKLHAKRCRKKQMKKVDFFFQIYFTTLAMPEETALRIFKDILHKFQWQKY